MKTSAAHRVAQLRLRASLLGVPLLLDGRLRAARTVRRRLPWGLAGAFALAVAFVAVQLLGAWAALQLVDFLLTLLEGSQRAQGVNWA